MTTMIMSTCLTVMEKVLKQPQWRRKSGTGSWHVCSVLIYESKLHPDKQPLVLTILIDLYGFRVCVHVIVDAIFYYIHTKQLSIKYGKCNAVFVANNKRMWLNLMFISYNLSSIQAVLRQLPDKISRFTSTINN